MLLSGEQTFVGRECKPISQKTTVLVWPFCFTKKLQPEAKTSFEDGSEHVLLWLYRPSMCLCYCYCSVTFVLV